MIKYVNISTEDFFYTLPESRIAKYPLEKRDRSKLLVFRNGLIQNHNFSDITKHIPPDSSLIFNTTRVIQARLIFKKDSGAKIEIFCLDPYFPVEYESAFRETKSVSWKCLIGNLKKWKAGILEKKFSSEGKIYNIKAEKAGFDGNTQLIKFTWNNNISFGQILDLIGVMPIPPYLGRESELSDKGRYQTIYSKIKGSVAAPTAGLHFTQSILSEMKEKKINYINLILHIGAGTFRPVSSKKVEDHVMHSEKIILSLASLKELYYSNEQFITVGTTSMRTIESIYWAGNKILNGIITSKDEIIINQWDPYENVKKHHPGKVLQALINFLEDNKLEYLNAMTSIIILPGYDFKLSNGLITNFHMPKSTLIMLIAAFIGDNWKKVYNYALENNYRFLSYGDSSLLLP